MSRVPDSAAAVVRLLRRKHFARIVGVGWRQEAGSAVFADKSCDVIWKG